MINKISGLKIVLILTIISLTNQNSVIGQIMEQIVVSFLNGLAQEVDQKISSSTISQNMHILSGEKTYILRVENTLHEHHGQYGWFMSVSSNSTAPRSSMTDYVITHKPVGQFKAHNRWKFIPQKEKEVYKIVLGDGPNKGYELYSFLDSQNDRRDRESYKVFIAPANYNNQFNKWELEKLGGNIYLIKNVKTNYYLCAHREMMDQKSDVSTWIQTHVNKDVASSWTIIEY